MATIKDVAHLAEVSTGTVDRILHKRGRFSEETAQKVYAAVEELGYKPNVLARNLSTSKTCHIAVLLPAPEQDSFYWSLPLSGMTRALDELNPYGISLEYFHFNRYEDASYRKALSLLEGEGYDGIIMAPLLEKASREFLQHISVPVIFIDTNLKEVKALAYVGQDSRTGGQLAAKLLNLLSRGEEGDYLIITPQAENSHLNERIGGFVDSIKRPYHLISTGIEAGHRREDYFASLDRAMAAPPAGIYVVDASVHHGAAYLKERECPEIPLVGFDLVKENREGIDQGVIDFILTQQPEEQGYRAVNLLFRHLMLGEKVIGDQIMATQIITKENLPAEG